MSRFSLSVSAEQTYKKLAPHRPKVPHFDYNSTSHLDQPTVLFNDVHLPPLWTGVLLDAFFLAIDKRYPLFLFYFLRK